MTIRDTEAVASLKILAALARADGTVHNDERKSLAAALESLDLEKPLPVDELLDSDRPIDVAGELAHRAAKVLVREVTRSLEYKYRAEGTNGCPAACNIVAKDLVGDFFSASWPRHQ